MLGWEAAMQSSEQESTVADAASSGQRAPQRLLRLRDVCRATGLCRSMIYKMQSEDKFPRRVKIGVRAVGWLEDEVAQWLTDRVASSRAAQR
jgi:prophage regulatory protein